MKTSTKEALDAHHQTGRPCGDFLTAMLENRLQALTLADPQNYADIKEIYLYIYNELPGASWGSPAKVKAWRSVGGAQGFLQQQLEWSKESQRLERTDA